MSGQKGQGLGARPHTWRSGPDPQRHDQYIAFLKQRAQARYRAEPWQLTFEEFEALWQHQWHRRGRASEDLCMSRLDYDQPWSVQNCRILSRAEHVRTSSRVKHLRGQIGPIHKRTFRIP